MFTRGGQPLDESYAYTETKFSEARRKLMLPPLIKEAQVLTEVFQLCRLGLNNISLDDLNERARDHASKLTALIERKETALIERKEKLSAPEKQELCDLINDLAYYFHDRWKGV
jgi:hypothetical protein